MNCDCDHPEREELYRKFTKHEVDTVADLLSCLKGTPTNSAFRRIAMLLLRGHYASPQNYADDFEHLRCYFWAPDGGAGTLAVDFTHNFDDNNPDNFPGIFVGFSSVAVAKLAIGNEAGFNDDNSAMLLSKGARLVLDIHHVTRNLDCIELAEMSMDMFSALSPMLRERTGAMAYEVAGYGEVKKIGESPDRYYDVVLKIEISYNHSVALNTESHRVRRISIGLTSEAATLP
jgi:hypothetical protein